MKKYSFLIYLLILSSFAQGQHLSTKGKDFWLGFMNNMNYVYPNMELSVYISSPVATSGTISIPGLSFTQNFTVPANSTTKVIIPNNAMVISNAVIENKGVHVTTLDTVTVYALNYKPTSSDACIIYPTHTLDMEYRVLCIQGWQFNMGQEYMIVATDNNTNIEITPYGGVPTLITLNAGQVYQVMSSNQLSGTYIKVTNCHKIAVFVGSVCDNIGGCGACNHLFEELLPVSRLGQNFVTTPLMNKAKDYFKLIAHYNGTAVTINNGTPILLSAGQTYQFFSNQANYIQASMPIFMQQYAQGNSCDGVGDPFSIVVPPVEQSIDDITFNTFTSTIITSYFVNIVTKTAYTSNLTLDGLAVNTFSLVAGNPVYSYARVGISSGNHRIISPHKFTASVYGFGLYEAYGYAAGFSLDNLEHTFTVNHENACPGDTIVFFVQNYPNIVNIKWMFGDGSVAYGQNVAHKYAVGNNYNVGLELTDNSGCTRDTIWKTIHISPPFQTTLNPSICQGDSFAVGTHYYNTTGIYRDTLLRISNGCDSIVTCNLTVHTKKQTSLNTAICQGKKLQVGNHFYTLAGNYIDTLSTIAGCDSIVSTNLTIKPLSQFAQSIKLCQGDKLNVGNHFYTNSGIYNDTLINYLGCDSIIKTNLIVTPYPVIDLGKDREICVGNTIELLISNLYTSYFWQDGNTNNSYLVSSPGKYWVTVANDNCIHSDTVKFSLCKRPIDVWIPNAFTPDGDGINDYFKIEASGEFSQFYLAIYNRWGNLVFETDNPRVVWDGKLNGNNAEADIYTYILTYSGKEIKQKKQINGKLTIVR